MTKCLLSLQTSAMTLGQRLRALREAKGLSRRRLGDLIDRTEGAIRNWEKDEDKPSLESLAALADQLGADDVLSAAFPNVRALSRKSSKAREITSAVGPRPFARAVGH